jgi:alkylated DNA nucleotide flippase Atl1
VINGSGRISTTGRDHEAHLQAQRLRRESVVVQAGGQIPIARFRWRPHGTIA